MTARRHYEQKSIIVPYYLDWNEAELTLISYKCDYNELFD
jgi:hypothetical protein